MKLGNRKKQEKIFKVIQRERERESERKKEYSWLFPIMTSKISEEYKNPRIFQVSNQHVTLKRISNR